MNVIASFIVSFLAFVALDAAWLGFLMKDFYTKSIPAAKAQPIIWLGLVVWLLIVFGIYYFVLPLSTSRGSAIVNGTLYGFVLYSVYELTNYIYLANWPLSVVMVDIAWGSFACAITSLLSYVVHKNW